MHEIITTSHAVLISEDLSVILVEKNSRFGGKITLFGGKLEDNESNLDGLKRELLEETGISFLDQEIKILIENDILNLGDKKFLGFIYYIIINKELIDKILKYSEKNTGIETSFNSLGKVDFAFIGIKSKIEECLMRLNSNKLNK